MAITAALRAEASKVDLAAAVHRIDLDHQLENEVRVPERTTVSGAAVKGGSQMKGRDDDQEPDRPERDRDDDDEAPETPPTEPEPVPVEEPPDEPTRRGPYVVAT
jgi:hypothetical protein